MKIGVVGGGVVGRATARAFLEHCDGVRVYDVVRERRTHPRDEVYECEVIFICTPESCVEDVIRGVMPEERGRNFVIKSTVAVGTTRRLAETYRLPNLCHSPEFLTARVACADAQMPSRNVIGVPFPQDGCGQLFTGANRGAQALNVLYHTRFPGVPVHLLSSDESELVKLASNGFFAAKLAYWNEVYWLAQARGLDWDRVLKAVLADGRISHAHTRVPGPDGKTGYGGACIVKDSEALAACIEEADLSAAVLRAALSRNRHDREGRGHP